MIMKKMKRFLSFAMSAMMVLTMGSSMVSADTDGTYSITINAKSTGHTYEAYQIFTGTVAQKEGSTKNILSDINWTENTGSDEIIEFIKDLKSDSKFATLLDNSDNIFKDIDETKVDSANARAIAEILTKNDTDTTAAEEFVSVAGKYFAATANQAVKSTDTFTTSEDNDYPYIYTMTDITPGYYIVKDKDDSLSGKENEMYTKYMLTVVGNASVYVKSGQTTISKQVSNNDVNYSKGVQSDVGDVVYFRLVVELPENTASFKTYELKFEDTLPKGLTFDKIQRIKIENSSSKEKADLKSKYNLDSEGTVTEVTEDNGKFIVDTSGLETNEDGTFSGGGTFTIRTGDLKTVDKSLSYGDSVIVVYTAILNENAVIGGDEGNVNKVILHYTNNPYSEETESVDDDPEGTTTEDKANVFTYNIKGTKYETDHPETVLKGAEFVIYREVTDSSGALQKEYAVKGTDEIPSFNKEESAETNPSDRVITEWKILSDDEVEESALKFTSDANGNFNIAGISNGTYYLKELKAPAGYNLASGATKIQVKATVVNNETNTLGYTQTLAINVPGQNDGKDVYSTDKTNVLVDIPNGAGSTLPSTGGMGRTLIYTIGLILTLSAAILLVVKKRMRANF